MIRTNLTFRATCFTLVAITFLAYCRWMPTVEKEAGVAADSAPNLALVAFIPSDPDREADDDRVVISGDLDSVDWSSMVGKKLTVTGDLVVVDTHDLARRGQVKVARDRLYVPTSRVDPNDADPNATSFEGGSNVAKVVGAQKYNDKATIILDDGSAKQNIFPPALFPDLGKAYPRFVSGL